MRDQVICPPIGGDDVYSAALIEAAITNGAFDWSWVRTDWGVVFEVAFSEFEAWSAFRDLPMVRAALDAAPDPINGVMIYPGRGGGASSRVPRPQADPWRRSRAAARAARPAAWRGNADGAPAAS